MAKKLGSDLKSMGKTVTKISKPKASKSTSLGKSTKKK